MHEGQIGICSYQVVEYSITKEVRYLMKGQVDWRVLSIRPDIEANGTSKLGLVGRVGVEPTAR